MLYVIKIARLLCNLIRTKLTVIYLWNGFNKIIPLGYSAITQITRSMIMRIILLIVSIFIVGCTQSSPTTPIQPDPNWTQGQLDNGVKYHIYPTDKEPVSLRLYVHIGSAHETEQQKAMRTFRAHGI